MHSIAQPRSRPWWPALALCAGLLAIVLGGFGVAHAPAGTGRVMRWQAAGHDWLLVADDAADQLIVYDASDGRPLRRLERAATGGIAALARRGGRLYVVGDDGAHSELRLPQLTVAAGRAR